ncbi:CheB methylesterase domain-containing protein [Campylobacter porcelli]|uniref:protein-glutamate methylesterase n=1 Tax=Campylobacter porcelli TaxID=1660073 RepID=A0A1X9SWB6_9BACT|nr:CheB methylesterase domain-containing protein [Campylobacter sp. RM6137]ARR00532.1 MCP protein-glutamate methylesterase [Campylobacter sp. RM6137]
MKQKLILIGASTGGPGHLKKLLSGISLPSNVSVVIAQHMNKNFVGSFANGLAQELRSGVELLNNKITLQNKIYICEQNSIMLNHQLLTANIDQSGVTTTYNPNVNMLFNSAVPLCRIVDVMGILLTGIGDDGASGLNELYKAGAKCIAENEQSAIVYGMPKRAKDINPKLEIGNLDMIKTNLQRFIV